MQIQSSPSSGQKPDLAALFVAALSNTEPASIRWKRHQYESGACGRGRVREVMEVCIWVRLDAHRPNGINLLMCLAFA